MTALGILVLGGSACLPDLCDDRIVQEVTAADNQYSAKVVVRNFGATTDHAV